ncbi:MAG: tetratricopeptide repeat protein, partial [Candidatus Omnitrophica bacterium]|nr:tetratricopeptide repeat protein [Candidatus Omnitrophota bacterium]
MPMTCESAESRPGDEQATSDWPIVISRLQQQLLERPGHALTRQQLATAYNNYGVSLSHEGQWDSAVQQLQEALRLDDTNRQFQENLSNVYLNQAYQAFQHQRLDEAFDTVKKVLALKPNHAQAYAL